MINNIKELEKIYNCTEDNLDWSYISKYQKLSEDFIEKYKYKVNWNLISTYQKLSEDFIEKYKYKVNWYLISIYQKLSEDFIEKYKDKVYWNYISIYQKLSEDFIEKYQNKINWDEISTYQKLSEEFIEKYQNKVDWNLISEYQKLSEEFRKKYNIKISEDNWLYKDIKFKRNYLKNIDTYEIDGDYIYAYKSCRPDGYSKFNFQYKYELNGIYTSHADFNIDNENSFGLSAWTLEGAKEYCKELIYKVKIHIEDIAAIVHENKKIRCTKLQIIEKVD